MQDEILKLVNLTMVNHLGIVHMRVDNTIDCLITKIKLLCIVLVLSNTFVLTLHENNTSTQGGVRVFPTVILQKYQIKVN